MTVDATTIEKGKCYATVANQVRRVIEVTDDKVKYEARGSRCPPQGHPWGTQVEVAKAKFAEDVDREVSCRWDPDYPEPK